MKKGRNFKTYVLGTLTGAVLVTGINYNVNKSIKQKDKLLIDEFPKPKYEQSFEDTKVIEQYTFDFYGGEITLEDENLEVYGFDEAGNVKRIETDKIEVPVEDNKYLLDEYMSEREALVYKHIENKDSIEDQFTIYLLFQELEELYKEYLLREPFDTLENRKEAIYNIGYNYIVAGEGYTIGGYTYKELDEAIQKDILEFYKNIYYMKNNNEEKETGLFNKFIDRQEKVFNYMILKKGRK